MKKVWLIVAALVIVVIGGAIVWTVLGARPNDGNSSDNMSNPMDVVDLTGKGQYVEVTMKNSKYIAQNIKVKKGTTVTWKNEDTVRHNVVALDANDQSGLPAENALFGKGETYSFTFETIGTYKYMCTPHPFMTGSVEVTE
jgi:amicyanin